MRGRDLSALPDRVALGVRLHRAADAYTDAHPAVAALRGRFSPELRRFAGIAIDVGLDHVAARTWPRAALLAPMPAPARTSTPSGTCRPRRPPAPDLAAHAGRVDSALRTVDPDAMPAALRRFAPHLIATMPAWAAFDGVRATLGRLSRRSARFAPLARTADELARLDGELASTFEALWPDAVRHVRDMLARHDEEIAGR